jgi:hypothetical protein
LQIRHRRPADKAYRRLISQPEEPKPACIAQNKNKSKRCPLRWQKNLESQKLTLWYFTGLALIETDPPVVIRTHPPKDDPGPDLAEHGVVRWRRIDLARVIEQRYGVKFAERSVGDLLFRRISVRPRCPEQDAAMQETHKKNLPIWSRMPSQRTRATNR